MKSKALQESEATFHFHTELRVRLPETDAMGIVFHGNFFTYLEVGRVDYLRNLGLSEGIRPIRGFENVVVSAHVDFKSPARFDDVLTVAVRMAPIVKGKRSFTFEFGITHKKTNRLVASGLTIHCAIDKNYRPICVPEEFRATVAAFEGWA